MEGLYTRARYTRRSLYALSRTRIHILQSTVALALVLAGPPPPRLRHAHSPLCFQVYSAIIAVTVADLVHDLHHTEDVAHVFFDGVTMSSLTARGRGVVLFVCLFVCECRLSEREKAKLVEAVREQQLGRPFKAPRSREA